MAGPHSWVNEIVEVINMAKKQQPKAVSTARDLEDSIRELVSVLLEGFNVKTQEDFHEMETQILDEVENLKEEFEGYLLERVEELPLDISDSDFEDEDEDPDFEDIDD